MRLTSGIVGTLTDVTSTATHPPGMVYQAWDETYGLRTFKYVKNNAGAATVASCAVVIDYNNAGVTATQQIKKPATASLNLFGGIALTAATDAYYQWIQVLGYTASLYLQAAATNASMASTVGSSVKAVNVQWYMTDDKAVGTEASYPKHAIILQTYSVTNASATKKAVIFAGEW